MQATTCEINMPEFGASTSLGTVGCKFFYEGRFPIRERLGISIYCFLC